ncbi:MAG TPA: hypothetical protein VHM19_02545 [Polyangiales bacterium]|jgi:hypothetical protein|nr:hypothetical protein [Polyangiales bacterium]
MHQSETTQLSNCLSCGDEISLSVDRPFLLFEDRAVCFKCAIARRGEYDESRDTWTRAPDMSGLRLDRYRS